MRRIPYLLIAIFSVFLLSSCNKFSKIQKSKDYEYKLAKAEEFYANKKYRYANQLFEELFPVFKGTQKFEDLYYKYAYCYYYQKMYLDAENLFKGYLEVFPTSERAEEIDFMRAYCNYKQSPRIELEQTNTVRAMGMMQTFINTHPGSGRVKEATEIIDICRAKLEAKDSRSAKLYYNLGHYRASAVAYENLLNSFPESAKADEYKLMVVKSYYKFAQLSIQEKKVERFEKVTEVYHDFMDTYPDSKYLKEAESFSKLSQNQINEIRNEQTSSAAKR